MPNKIRASHKGAPDRISVWPSAIQSMINRSLVPPKIFWSTLMLHYSRAQGTGTEYLDIVEVTILLLLSWMDLYIVVVSQDML